MKLQKKAEKEAEIYQIKRESKLIKSKNKLIRSNEDMIKDIIHKRNKSHWLDGSVIIKLPKGFDISEKNEPEEIKNIEDIKRI